MKSPAITVIVPVYNQEHLLKRCVNSILNQEYKSTMLSPVDS